MTTLQEQFERDFPDKSMRFCFDANKKYENSNFTNYDLDLGEYKNLELLHLGRVNNLTSLNVSNCPKLKNLLCDDYLFLENKIKGLEKTSIDRIEH